MRSTILRIDITELESLNQFMVKNAPPGTYLTLKKLSTRKDDEEVQLKNQQQLSEDDDFSKVLDYVPSDFSTLSSLLSEQIQLSQKFQNSQEEGIDVDEEAKHDPSSKRDTSQKSIWVLSKEFCTQNKINESFNKCIDKFLSQIGQDPSKFIRVETIIFPKL